MNEETLFINDEYFGSETYVGTREQFKTGLAECFKQWFNKFDYEDDDYTLEAFIEDELDKHLKPADDEDIAYYPRLDD